MWICLDGKRNTTTATTTTTTNNNNNNNNKKNMRWTSRFIISSCGNEPRTLSPRAHTTLTSCWILYRYSFVLKRIGLGHTNENGFPGSRYLIAKFFEVHGQKKKTLYKNEKENMPKNSKDRLTALGKKTHSCQRQISKKRSKTGNQISIPARGSVKRPLTPFSHFHDVPAFVILACLKV